MQDNTLTGLDVQKAPISVAAGQGERCGVTHLWKLSHIDLIMCANWSAKSLLAEQKLPLAFELPALIMK